MYSDPTNKIYSIINKSIKGIIGLSTFQRQFEELYLDQPGYSIVSEKDVRFYNEILEKIGWTSDSPSEKEKDMGWIDYEEFREWLRERYEAYAKERREG